LLGGFFINGSDWSGEAMTAKLLRTR
jgi:hypothetical protein